MSAVENIDPEKEPSVPWVPRVITGGKGPPEGPPPSGGNWLVDLPVGTTFVAQPRGSAEMNLYHVEFADPDCYLLCWSLPDGKMLDMYYNPEDFCKQMKSYFVLGRAPIQQEETNGNEQSDRADQSGPLVLHEAVPGECRVSEEADGPSESDRD